MVGQDTERTLSTSNVDPEQTAAAQIDPEQIDAFAAVALENLSRAYPYQTQHVQTGPEDIYRPEDLHPAFANSFDWHSSVHMHWLLTTVTEATAAVDGLGSRPWHGQAIEVLTEHLSPANLAAETEYVLSHPTWERPYGWAWAAELADALRTASTPELGSLAAAAGPLLDAVFTLTLAWLPKTPEPVRHGLHTNVAFGLRRIRRVALAVGRDDVVTAIDSAARRFYGDDEAWAFDQERSGQDFLSGGFCEADLMIDVLPDDELSTWLPGFLSTLTPDSRVLKSVTVLDPTDGYQSHLDGLGLTAAASALRVARVLRTLPTPSGIADTTRLAQALEVAAPQLMAPGLTAAVSEEYMASHWLATFAYEALVEANR
jgi:hypothetical protein